MADISGKIKVINVASGVCLKDVTENKKQKIEFQSEHGSSSEED
jgi:hypothetical protein